ncbi:protein transport protein Sec61 subunit gamma-like [Grammomys surdaster]|uniref:protein transport protein Sec61 subunit gamma-like n=1 Tax=Grammomys surdaster TaxID=491861 RepID=UPI00109F48F4|nr:protein transport protein Sec61 subunit gamma-like [Grammomys surdaster]
MESPGLECKTSRVSSGLLTVAKGRGCSQVMAHYVSLPSQTADPTNVEQAMQFFEPSRPFVKDSIRLLKRCIKPDRREFQKVAMATAIGFAIMRFTGFFVKLIPIPVHNILVGG